MSNSGKLSVADFPVAPRRQKQSSASRRTSEAPSEEAATDGQQNGGNADLAETGNGLRVPSARSRQAALQERALVQEDSRNRLKELSRGRQRQSKHYVNAPLDYELKKRLERAAHENDLKMTVIIKDALDQYLKDNGY